MAKRTAANKGRMARPPQKPLRPFPYSHHPPTYVAISCNLTNNQPQPGDAPPECIDMGVTVFRGKAPFYSHERDVTTLSSLMKQTECYHVINKKHCKADTTETDKNTIAARKTLYTSIYAKSQILEGEDEMKDWLWKLLQDSRKIDKSTPTWTTAKTLEANYEQHRTTLGASYESMAPKGSQEREDKIRNLVLMDWGSAGTDKLLQRWGILANDKLRINEGSRVQFWDLRQWDRVASVAPNPSNKPRDFTAALKALGIGSRCFETVEKRLRDVRGNAGNDAWLKLAIYFSSFTMTTEEEVALMMTGRPLDRDVFLLTYKAETLKANRGLRRSAQ